MVRSPDGRRVSMSAILWGRRFSTPTATMHTSLDKGRTSDGYATLFALAQGGMGCVDLVVRRKDEFERLYAMKTLRPHLLEDESIRRMFVEEARIAGLLHHPNVVSVVDVGEGSAGPYLILEYVEGMALSALMGGLDDGELLPIEVCTQIALEAARGLDAAHGLTSHSGQPMHLVHRDVSPQNLLLGFDGVVRVTDFGIAKALDREGQAATATGVLKGKVGYMSPEQLTFRQVDHRTDLYALGVVLFELLSGRRLYPGGRGSNAAQRIISEPTPDILEYRNDVPTDLVELLFALLQKDSAQRPSSTEEVCECLARVTAEYGADQILKRFLDERFERQQRETRASVLLALEEEKSIRRTSTQRRWGGAATGLALIVFLAVFLATQTDAEGSTRSVQKSETVPILLPSPPEPAEPVLLEPTTLPPPPHSASGLPMEAAGSATASMRRGRSSRMRARNQETVLPAATNSERTTMTPTKMSGPESWWGLRGANSDESMED